jgi:hypothetical protein
MSMTFPKVIILVTVKKDPQKSLGKKKGDHDDQQCRESENR